MNASINRRRLLVGGAASAVATAGLLARPAAAIAAEAVAAADDSPGWIDAHVHVWTPDTRRYPVGPNFTVADMVPPSFTADQLLAHCRPENVERIVLIQMNFYELDHRYLLAVMRQHPGVFSAVGLVDHQSPAVAAAMNHLAAQGVRGFRLHSLGDAKDWPHSETMATLWKKAAADGLAVCPLINPEDLPHIDVLCKRFPDTTVVVDHFARIGVSGRIDAERLDALCRLARFPNVHVKTSAFYALGAKASPYTDLTAMIQRVLDAFGPQRLMWGSDCPYQVQDPHTYHDSIALIRDSMDSLSATEKQWILRDTAEKVFFS